MRKQTDALGKELRALKPEEWSALRNKVDVWFKLRGDQVASSTVRSPVGAGSLLLDACHRELVRIGRATPRQPYPKKLLPQASKTADLVFGHILESFDTNLKLPQQMQAAAVVAGVLIRQLPGSAVSAKGVLLNIDKVPVALDRAFPGYARAGLLSHVLKKKRRGSNGV